METVDVQALGEGNVSNGVLVVHCSGGDERYEITKVPAETAFLVQDAKKQILRNLKLESVLKDLDRASNFLFLAYLGVVGTGELQDRISRRQKDLSDLYAEFVMTMHALQQDSRTVLGKLTEAYSYLLEAKEELALRVFSSCAINWSTMSIKCEELADGFRKLMDDTREDAQLICRVVGYQVEEIDALQKLRMEMEETKKRKEALRDDINVSLRELEFEIRKEEARLDSADKYSFFGGIIDGLGGLSPVGNLVALVTSAQQANQSKELPNSILNMLKKKSALETLRRDAVEQLALLLPVSKATTSLRH